MTRWVCILTAVSGGGGASQKQERDLQKQLASKQAEAAGPSRGRAAAGPSAPRLERAERSRVEAQEVEIAALKQQLEALRAASHVADTAERPVVAATPQCQTYRYLLHCCVGCC